MVVFRSEFANDLLNINTLAGDDRVDTDGLEIGVIKLFVDGSWSHDQRAAARGMSGAEP